MLYIYKNIKMSAKMSTKISMNMSALQLLKKYNKPKNLSGVQKKVSVLYRHNIRKINHLCKRKHKLKHKHTHKHWLQDHYIVLLNSLLSQKTLFTKGSINYKTLLYPTVLLMRTENYAVMRDIIQLEFYRSFRSFRSFNDSIYLKLLYYFTIMVYICSNQFMAYSLISLYDLYFGFTQISKYSQHRIQVIVANFYHWKIVLDMVMNAKKLTWFNSLKESIIYQNDYAR